MGNVIQAGEGQAPARQSALGAGKERKFLWSVGRKTWVRHVALGQICHLYGHLCNLAAKKSYSYKF